MARESSPPDHDKGIAMTDVADRQSFSFGDALFLYLEREGMPLHVASLCLFEGKIPLGQFVEYVESRLPLIPRYRQRVAIPPCNLGLPSWQFDPAFDLRNHLREVRLKRGTEAELRAAASRILSDTLDRSRPLWDMTMFAMEGNRTALLTRVHHSLADGLSGVELMNAVLDPTAKTTPAPRASAATSPAAGAAEPSVLEAFVQSCFIAVQQVLTAETELLGMAQHVLAAASQPHDPSEPNLHNRFNGNGSLPSLEDINRLVPELLSAAERLPFNVVCRGPQKYECAQVPLPELKAIKHACGVTLNDVLLGLVTATVRRYAQVHKVGVARRSLRIIVPVSMRGKAEMNELGNHITFVPVNVPMGSRRVRGMVEAAHERVVRLKASHIAELVGMAGTLLGAIPGPLQAAMAPVASQLPLSVCNLICTDVPGPREALYLMGHKMLTCWPYVPIGGEMGLNIAVLTYNGTAYVGFTGDVHAVPDLRLLPKFFLESFAELRKDAGVKLQRERKHRTTTKKKMVKAAAALPVLDFPPKRVEQKKAPEKTFAVGA